MNLADLEILEYTEQMGRIDWPVGFEQELEGKSIAEQLAYYRVADWGLKPLSYYLINWTKYSGLEPLEQYSGWEKIILREGKVAGFVRRGRTILPYWVVASDYTSENNGSGYKERTDYYYLVCVPGKPERERIFTPPFGAPVPELTVPVIPYEGDRSEDLLPPEMARRLEGKPLSVQMYYFAVHGCNPGPKPGWEDNWERYAPYYLDDLCRHRGGYLPFREDVAALIVHEGKIVGVRLRLPENAVEGGTMDLYPYEVCVYHYRYPYSSTEYPAKLQLICKSLPG